MIDIFHLAVFYDMFSLNRQTTSNFTLLVLFILIVTLSPDKLPSFLHLIQLTLHVFNNLLSMFLDQYVVQQNDLTMIHLFLLSTSSNQTKGGIFLFFFLMYPIKYLILTL